MQLTTTRGSLHNALNPRRITRETVPIKNLRTDQKIHDGRAQRRVRETLNQSKSGRCFIEWV